MNASSIPPVPRSIPSEESTRHFPPVLRPDLQALYAARASRLRSLAEGHELQDYLCLAAAVADAQAAIVRQPSMECAGTAAGATQPIHAPADHGATHDTMTVLPARIAAAGNWHPHLDAILAALAPHAPAAVDAHLAALQAMPKAERNAAGIALAEGRFDAVPAALAPFLWAALALEVARAARAAPLPRTAAQESPYCPACGNAPVASLILTGENQGLRYLHCPLCECEWHMVRAKCTNCGDARQLDYFSFDTAQAVVRAESCGHCDGYLKVVSQEADPKADAVADDLASLALDDATTAEGFHRTGFNPFALPSDTP